MVSLGIQFLHRFAPFFGRAKLWDVLNGNARPPLPLILDWGLWIECFFVHSSRALKAFRHVHARRAVESRREKHENNNNNNNRETIEQFCIGYVCSFAFLLLIRFSALMTKQSFFRNKTVVFVLKWIRELLLLAEVVLLQVLQSTKLWNRSHRIFKRKKHRRIRRMCGFSGSLDFWVLIDFVRFSIPTRIPFIHPF